MKIGVDIDGVLTDLNERMVERAKTQFGKTITPENIYREEELAEAGITKHELSLMFTPEFFFNMKPYKENIDAIQRLAQNGNEIHIVTARPSGTEAETERWLAQQAVPWDSLTFSEDKDIIALQYQLDRFIEDFTSNANKIAKVVKRVYLINQPYNQNDETRWNVVRIDGVKELETRLRFVDMEYRRNLGETKEI